MPRPSAIVTVDHAATPADAASLTGFVQGVGYLIAGLFPFAAGFAPGMTRRVVRA
ncbi:hypothetical protein KTD23_19340 [Burkholderia multivorans]|nr:hypothetical protein [Burkholderia multivorans]